MTLLKVTFNIDREDDDSILDLVRKSRAVKKLKMEEIDDEPGHQSAPVLVPIPQPGRYRQRGRKKPVIPFHDNTGSKQHVLNILKGTDEQNPKRYCDIETELAKTGYCGRTASPVLSELKKKGLVTVNLWGFWYLKKT